MHRPLTLHGKLWNRVFHIFLCIKKHILHFCIWGALTSLLAPRLKRKFLDSKQCFRKKNLYAGCPRGNTRYFIYVLKMAIWVYEWNYTSIHCLIKKLSYNKRRDIWSHRSAMVVSLTLINTACRGGITEQLCLSVYGKLC